MAMVDSGMMSASYINERDRIFLEKARVLKDEGNKFYAEKEYGKAIRQYHQCLLHARALCQLVPYPISDVSRPSTEVADHEDIVQVEDATFNAPGIDGRKQSMKSEASELIRNCYNNLAACILNGQNRFQDDFLRAASYCDKVLELDEQNEKARYRKGVSLANANMPEKAIEVLKLCPKNNKDVQHQITICEQKIKADRKKRDEQIQVNFTRANQRQQLREQQRADQDGHAEAVIAPIHLENGVAANGELPNKEN